MLRNNLPALALAVAALLVSVEHGHAEAAASQIVSTAKYNIDTPLHELVKNPKAKAVVDHYVHGISEGPHYLLFFGFSLRQLKPMLSGRITNAVLDQMGRELAEIR